MSLFWNDSEILLKSELAPPLSFDQNDAWQADSK